MARSLMISACCWGLGFLLVWLAGVTNAWPIVWAGLALAAMAIATVSYTPIASALVVSLAPAQLRGVYFSMNSMCWAMGYFIGPPIGGWALDQSRAVADGFWLGAAMSITVAIAILVVLDQRLKARAQSQL